MKMMLAGFAAMIVISVAANYILAETRMSTPERNAGQAVRLD